MKHSCGSTGRADATSTAQDWRGLPERSGWPARDAPGRHPRAARSPVSRTRRPRPPLAPACARLMTISAAHWRLARKTIVELRCRLRRVASRARLRSHRGDVATEYEARSTSFTLPANAAATRGGTPSSSCVARSRQFMLRRFDGDNLHGVDDGTEDVKARRERREMTRRAVLRRTRVGELRRRSAGGHEESETDDYDESESLRHLRAALELCYGRWSAYTSSFPSFRTARTEYGTGSVPPCPATPSACPGPRARRCRGARRAVARCPPPARAPR